MPALLGAERPAAGEFNPYFSRYIDLVTGDDLREVLTVQAGDTLALLAGLDEARAMHRYAPGKWSVKEVTTHVIDCERVFTYRALHFARNDRNVLPGFEENDWAPESRADARSIADLAGEFRAVRTATIALLGGLDAQALSRIGTANTSLMNARAAFWIIAGHELHHRTILKARYGLGS